MYNNGVIVKKSGAAPVQILANVELQYSVGAVIAQAVGTKDDTTGKTIAKAGTPVTGSLTARTTAFTAASGSDTGAVGLLLHDVDLTNGDANGTVLIFGFVNKDMIDSTTQALLTDAIVSELDGKVTFLTV